MVQRHRTLIVCSAYRTHSRASCSRSRFQRAQQNYDVSYTAAHRVQTGGDYFQDEAVWSTGLPIRPAPRLPTFKNSTAYQLQRPLLTTSFADRSFAVAAPTVWNSLSLSTRSANTFDTFKSRLKTELVMSAYTIVGFSAIIALPIRLRFYALYKCT